MNINERLKEERERLEMTQEAFGAAGGVLKRAVAHYEKGERVPDAAFLAHIAEAGADVQYILTGQRRSDSSGLPPGTFFDDADRPVTLKELRLGIECAAVASGIACAAAMQTLSPQHVDAFYKHLVALAPAVGAADKVGEHLLNCTLEGVSGLLRNS